MSYLKKLGALLAIVPMLLMVQPAAGQTGMELYGTRGCGGCHATGIVSAPIVPSGNWQERFDERGLNGIYTAALTGQGLTNMPPCGGSETLANQCRLIIDWMLAQAGVSTAPPDPKINLELKLYLEGSLKE